MMRIALLLVLFPLLLIAVPSPGRAQDAVPLESLLTSSAQPQSPTQLAQSGYRTAQGTLGSTSPVGAVASQVEGDFIGWDGKTIIRLVNGQIWRQSEYYYEYHYAYMPKALIYPSGGGYKMKVEGTQPVAVERLR